MLAPAGAVAAKRVAIRGRNLVTYSSRVIAFGLCANGKGPNQLRSAPLSLTGGTGCERVWRYAMVPSGR